jgi:hypothetical protein
MRRQVATLFAISIASSARADDWAQPIVTLQQSLAALGISLGGGVTGFAQGLASGDGKLASLSGERPTPCSDSTGESSGCGRA